MAELLGPLGAGFPETFGPALWLVLPLATCLAGWLGASWRIRRALEVQRSELARASAELADSMTQRTSDLAGVHREQMRGLRESVTLQLEQVQRGVGEIQGLASGLADLERELWNVKRRGSWGEAQLEQILADLMSPEQYALQAAPRPGSSDRVDAALRLPQPDGSTCLLPIDAKLPREDYVRLLRARERGDSAGVTQAARQLGAAVRREAQRVRSKYVHPPHTTELAILFLPTESLHAEVLQIPDLLRELQRDLGVTLAGPATLGALLGSIRLGLRAQALDARASEVSRQLGGLRSQLERLVGHLERTRRHVEGAARALDLAGGHAGGLLRSIETLEAVPPHVSSAAPDPAPESRGLQRRSAASE